jgi:hypothetical protein
MEHIRVENTRTSSTVVSEEGETVQGLGFCVVVTGTLECSGWVGNGAGLLGGSSGGDGCDDIVDDWGGSSGDIGGRSLRISKVVVLPRDDLPVDGGDDHVRGALLHSGLCLSGAFVELLVTVAAALDVGVAALLGGGERVGCELLQGDWATEVEGNLLIEGGERSGEALLGGGTLPVGAHVGDLVVGSSGSDIKVLDGLDGLAVPVAANLLGSHGALVGDGTGAEGQNGGSDLGGELHDYNYLMGIWS